MRIVMVNWARIADGASHGGGANVYAQQLALELVGLGHEVLWLHSGLAYVPDPATRQVGPCKVRRMEDFHDVRVFEVINSPVVAPGPCQAREPLGEVSAPALEAEVGRFFELVQPDVVHFHNIEGFSCGCVDAARTARGPWGGARVVFSLHNYHTICPQVYLMKLGRRACHDFRGGEDCAACMADMRPPAEEKTHRASYHMPRIEATRAPAKLGERLAGVFAAPPPPPPPPMAWPGRPAETFVDIVADERKSGARERSGYLSFSVPPPAVQLDPSNPEWVPLENVANPDPSFTPQATSDYAERRRAMVGMLNRCDRVLAVSRFVKAKFEAMGVSPGVITAQHIGTRMADVARVASECLQPPPPLEGRPVRAVFLGYNNYYKGLPMLADTLEMMDPAALSRLHLCVYAKAVEEIEWRLNRLEPRLAGLSIRSGYKYEEIPRLLYGKDVGLVPSVWWDNGPQTVMEFFACGMPVIAAHLGGIPDIAVHGHNALLHRGNDRQDLARTLEGVLRDPGVLVDLRRNVRPPRSMGEHAGEVERVYLEALSNPGSSGPAAISSARSVRAAAAT
jgi:glycosyltransferase involved in cell wall biosynthesis